MNVTIPHTSARHVDRAEGSHCDAGGRGMPAAAGYTKMYYRPGHAGDIFTAEQPNSPDPSYRT